MFETIVMATDLSPAWDEIVVCAGEFKALGCSRVILTHVITVKFFVGLEATLRAEAEPKLAEQKEMLMGQGFHVEVEMPMGLPAYSLNDVARRHGADLIVVGSHGKSLWREGVLGCVSCAVLHHAEHPVLLLHVKVNKDKEAGTCRLDATELLRHVLHPTDFSEIAQRAFAYLERLAPQGVVAQTTLLHALEGVADMPYPPGFKEAAEASAQESLAELRERLLAAGVSTVNMRLSFGHPVQLILDTMKSQDFSLIVLGTQGKGFIEEIFLGSVAHNITRLASCPVLLIPPVSR